MQHLVSILPVRGLFVAIVFFLNIFLNMTSLKCVHLTVDIQESISVVQSKRASLNK